MSRVTTYDVVDMNEYYQTICKHEKQTYQPDEWDSIGNKVAHASFTCDECAMDLPMPQEDDLY